MSAKVTVFISKEEQYPDYVLTDERYGAAVEIHPATLARWKRIVKNYRKVQDEMAEALGEEL